jgi:hypothetical protein
VWTHRAERRLQIHLDTAQVPRDKHRQHRGTITTALALAFPDADDVIVLELHQGFRPRVGEYIVHADVHRATRPGTVIVKIAEHARLEQEWNAWRNCRPHAQNGDTVFMALNDCRHPSDPQQIVALVYQDAQSHIPSDEIVSLETAVVRSVQWGSPHPHSLVETLRTLYEPVDRALYVSARVDTPETLGITLNPQRGTAARRSLADYLPAWGTGDAGSVRRQVGAALMPCHPRYIDPIDYMEFLEAELRSGVPAGQLFPRRLRGPAHGDLHGRNVLVGIDDHRAGAPALFDYEHMSCDNLLCWDFVKLETETKIRALAAYLPRTDVGMYALRVEAIETRIAEQTRECRHRREWRTHATDTPDDRLCAIVLGIREQAEVHLGARRNRNGDWHHEYNFMLACYGVSTVNYGNHSPEEQTATLVSAGVSAAQYEHGRPGAG